MSNWAKRHQFPLAGNHLNVGWIIDASFAHPIWSQYILCLYDLRPHKDHPETYLARPGMTHECMLYALDPHLPLTINDNPFDKFPTILHPANHGYQFVAKDDAAAEARLQELVDWIVAMRLSPDTDYTAQWDSLFRDGVSLKYNALEALLATKQ